MLFSKEKAELQARIEALEASLAEANTKLEAATTELTTLREKLATAEAESTRQAEEHAKALKAKDEEVTGRVEQGVIDGLAAAGVPEAKLPARTPTGETGAASTYAEALEHYNSLTDPKAAAEYYANTVSKFLN